MNEEEKLSQAMGSENVKTDAFSPGRQSILNEKLQIHNIRSSSSAVRQIDNRDVSLYNESEDEDKSNYEAQHFISKDAQKTDKKSMKKEVFEMQIVVNDSNKNTVSKIERKSEGVTSKAPTEDLDSHNFKSSKFDGAGQTDRLDISDIAVELNVPRLFSYQSKQQRLSIVQLDQMHLKSQSGFNYENDVTISTKKPNIKFQTPVIRKKSLSKRIKVPNSEGRQQAADENSYSDADSMVMSERSRDEHNIINRISLTDRKLPKPQIYNQQQSSNDHQTNNNQQLSLLNSNAAPHTTFRQSAQNSPDKPEVKSTPFTLLYQETARVRDRATLPQKKNMDFTLITSPHELEDENSGRQPIQEMKLEQNRLQNQENQHLKSLISWESEDLKMGGEGMECKSYLPFSVAFQGDLEHQNGVEDTIKFSRFDQTPKMMGYSYSKGNRTSFNQKGKHSHYNSLAKSSLGGADDDLLDQLQRINTVVFPDKQSSQHNNYAPPLGNIVAYQQRRHGTLTPNTGKEPSKFYNTQQSMQIIHGKQLKQLLEEAQNRGQQVRRELEYFKFRANNQTQEYVLPEGTIILNEKGPIVIEGTDLLILNGINGSKIIVGESNTFVIKDHLSERLIFRAIQFEMSNQNPESAFETPRGNKTQYGEENILMQIIQSEETKRGDGIQIVKQIVFEDCSFIHSDVATGAYETKEAFMRSVCSKAIEIKNFSSQIRYEIIFQNCIFLGFHHAIQTSIGQNTRLEINDSLFKQQMYESILLTDIEHLQINKCILKKCCVSDQLKSAICLNFTKSGTKQSVIELESTVIRKSKGMGLQIRGFSDQINVQILINSCTIMQNDGFSAFRIQGLRNDGSPMEGASNKNDKILIDDDYKQLCPFNEIKVIDTKIINNKKNGVEVLNNSISYSFERCFIRENKFSGIVINENYTSEQTNYYYCNCCETEKSQQSFLMTSESGRNKQKKHQQKTDYSSLNYQSQNVLEKCEIQMNQMHGIEIVNTGGGLGFDKSSAKANLQQYLIESCSIEDNFCDGINISCDETMNAIEEMGNSQENNSKDEGGFAQQTVTQQPPFPIIRKLNFKRKSTKKAVSKLNLNANRIFSNKNNGISFASMMKNMRVYLYSNDFQSNLGNDCQISEDLFNHVRFISVNGKDTNILEQEDLPREFHENHMNTMGDDSSVQPSLTENAAADNNDDNSSLQFFQQASSGIMKKKNSMNKKSGISCLGLICTPCYATQGSKKKGLKHSQSSVSNYNSMGHATTVHTTNKEFLKHNHQNLLSDEINKENNEVGGVYGGTLDVVSRKGREDSKNGDRSKQSCLIF